MGDAEACREYEVKLFIIQGHIVIRIIWDGCPVPLMEQFTQQGKSCSIVLEKASNHDEATTPSASTYKQEELLKSKTFRVYRRSLLESPSCSVGEISNNCRLAGVLSLHRVWDEERCLGLSERPLILFKQLDKEGRKPMFMLRRHPTPVEGKLMSVTGRAVDSRSSAVLPGGVSWTRYGYLGIPQLS